MIDLFLRAAYTVKRRKPKVAPVRDSVVQYIARHPRCTMRDVQLATNTTDRAIASWLHRLHRDGVIAREAFATTKFGGRPRYVFWSKP